LPWENSESEVEVLLTDWGRGDSDTQRRGIFVIPKILQKIIFSMKFGCPFVA
jgi:hypothetical protein